VKNIKSRWLLTAGIVSLAIITYTYGKSMTLIYGGFELIIAAVCYAAVFSNIKRLDNITSRLILIVTCMSLINGAFSGDLKSVLLMSIPMVMILSVSVIPMSIDDDGRDFMWAYFIGTAVAGACKLFDLFDSFNPNTMGFFYFMVLTLGFTWFRATRYKLFAFITLIPGAVLCLFSGSRNVAVMIIVAFILVLIPKLLYRTKSFYRIIYGLVLLYTVFAPFIIVNALNNASFYRIIEAYTSTFSNKAWSLITRAEFFHIIEAKIAALSPYHLMFGTGILQGHSHNLFYQSLLVYGAVGAIFVYLLLIRVFEMAGRLIRERGDNVALGLAISLASILLLNGADLFIFATESYPVLPQMIIGIIIYRYKKAFCEDTDEIKLADVKESPTEAEV